jgi:hypothetical protein
MKTKLVPVHPGEVLSEDFMKPLKLSAYKVAKDLGIPPIRITQIMNCTSTETDKRPPRDGAAISAGLTGALRPRLEESL